MRYLDNRGISVHGDGNIIGGNNNRTYVDKRQTIINQLHENGHGKPNSPKPDDSFAGLLGISVFVIFVIVFATLKFCLYAPFIFKMLEIIAICAGVSATVLTFWLHDRSNSEWFWWQLLAIAGVAIAGCAVWLGQTAYPLDATRLALQANAYGASAWKVFLCNLNAYGRSVTSLQMMSVAVFSTGSLMLGVLTQLLALSRAIFEITGWFITARIAAKQQLWISVVCVLVGFLAMMMQTEMVQVLWNEVVSSPSVTQSINRLCRF